MAQWLREEGFAEYEELLCTQHRLDGPSLLALTESDLHGPPLGLTVLGDIKRMALALRRLQGQNVAHLEGLGLKPGVGLPAVLPLEAAGLDCNRAERRCNGHFCNGTELRLRTIDNTGYDPVFHTHFKGRNRQHLAGRLDPEVWKTVISSIYVMFVFGFTSFVMVIVHERVPDMRTYPPLPDIFLDR